MNKQAVVSWIGEQGFTVIQLAKLHKVSRQTIYSAIEGSGSRRIRVIIAILINKAPSLIWQGNSEESLLVDDYWYMRKTS